MQTMEGSPDTSTVSTAPAVLLSRDQIMQVTGRCLREVGYDATTIRKIASTLGCAVGSIYRYFRDKRDLLFAVTQQVMNPVVEFIETGGAFEKSLTLYLQCVENDPESYRLMFWLACMEPEKQAMRLGPQAATDQSAQLPPVIRRILEGWSRRLGDAALARRCWATLHGSIMLGENSEQLLVSLRDLINDTGHVKHSAPPAKAVQITPSPVVLTTQPQRIPPPASHASQPSASSLLDDVCLL